MVAVVTVLALCEIALRCLNIPSQLEQEWLLQPDPLRKRVFDDDTLLANLEFLDENHYSTEGGKKTIVALGDSFTAGFKVAPSDRYLTVLQEVLHEHGIDATIINMGMGYSGHDQHLAILEHKVLPRLRPDVVIWQWCHNDFWDNVELSLYRMDDESRLTPHGIDKNWLYMRERIWRCIPGPLGIIRRTYLFRLVLSATNYFRTATVPAEYRNDCLEYGRRKSRLIIEEMGRLSKEYGFKLILVLVDLQCIHLDCSETLPGLHRWCFDAQKAMLSQCENYIDTQFSLDDLSPVNAHFSTRITSVGHGLFLDGDQDGAAPGIRHYNRYGYWLFARKIGQYLCTHRDSLFD